MIAIRTYLALLPALLLTTVLGTVAWTTPTHAQEPSDPPPSVEYSVTFECTASGADVTFTNDEDFLGIQVFWGSLEQRRGSFSVDAGESETISTDLDTLYYTVFEDQGDPASDGGNLDLSSCPDPGDPDDDDDEDDDDDDDDDGDDDAPRIAPDAGI